MGDRILIPPSKEARELAAILRCSVGTAVDLLRHAAAKKAKEQRTQALPGVRAAFLGTLEARRRQLQFAGSFIAPEVIQRATITDPGGPPPRRLR